MHDSEPAPIGVFGPEPAEQAGRIISTVDRTVVADDSMCAGDEEHHFRVAKDANAVLKAAR